MVSQNIFRNTLHTYSHFGVLILEACRIHDFYLIRSQIYNKTDGVKQGPLRRPTCIIYTVISEFFTAKKLMTQKLNTSMTKITLHACTHKNITRDASTASNSFLL